MSLNEHPADRESEFRVPTGVVPRAPWERELPKAHLAPSFNDPIPAPRPRYGDPIPVPRPIQTHGQIHTNSQTQTPDTGDIRPDYYGGPNAVYEPWKVMRAHMTPTEYRGYLRGTALAYLLRGQGKATNRSTPELDARKAVTVLNELVRFDKDDK